MVSAGERWTEKRLLFALIQDLSITLAADLAFFSRLLRFRG